MSRLQDDELLRIARSLGDHTPPERPVALFARRVDAYEIDFQGLCFQIEEPLPAIDRAVLGLAHGLGRIGLADPQCYLGIGGVLSELLLHRLVRQGLLRDEAAEDDAPGDGDEDELEAYGTSDTGAQLSQRRPTRAHAIESLPVAEEPSFVLSEAGREALEQRRRQTYRYRACRLVFWAEPLHFAGVAQEPARTKRSAAARSKPLSPERVPKPFLAFDELLALPAAEREQTLGFAEVLPGFEGHLVGCAPDSQWEVRVADRFPRTLLVLAGYPHPEGLVWRTFVGSAEQLTAAPRMDAGTFGLEYLLSPEALDRSVAGLGLQRATWTGANWSNAAPVLADGEELLHLLGSEDTPSDCWAALPGTHGGGWTGAVSLRGIPGSPGSAHLALFQFLCRRKGALLDGLDGAVAATWADLQHYWGSPRFPEPSREWLVARLWTTPDMRHVVCQSRLRRDLVEPYLASGETA